MSMQLQCDRCKGGTFNGSEEDAVERGWKIQDYGHTCSYCTIELAEIEKLGSSSIGSTRQIAEALTEGLKK